MKTFAFACLLGVLAGPVMAETPAGHLSRCVDQGQTDAMTADCTAIRATYFAQINACMESARVISPDLTKMSSSGGNHAFRARYLICIGEVKGKNGPFGQ